MEIVTTQAEIAKSVNTARSRGDTVGFVPTLGALHEGHMSLVQEAKKRCNYVLASVFVNPAQFNDPKDLERYPRQLTTDAELLAANGCDLLFAPSVDVVYGNFDMVTYDLGTLDNVLEGPTRPGHFQGVVNVIERLFHLVKPDLACFGKKDRQQLAVIQHVTRELGWPVEILACPTVRENDGLAMSSRNALLDADERKLSVGLFKALCLAEEDTFKLDLRTLKVFCVQVLERHQLKPEYFDIVHPDTLASLTSVADMDHAIAISAAFCGKTRLIDNLDVYR